MACRIRSIRGSGPEQSCERFAGSDTSGRLRRMVFMAMFRATPNNQARGEEALASLSFERMAWTNVSWRRSWANWRSPTIRRRYPNIAGPWSWYNRSIGSITHPSANSIRTNSPESILMWRLEHKKFRKNLLYPRIYSGGCVAGCSVLSS